MYIYVYTVLNRFCFHLDPTLLHEMPKPGNRNLVHGQSSTGNTITSTWRSYLRLCPKTGHKDKQSIPCKRVFVHACLLLHMCFHVFVCSGIKQEQQADRH